MQHFLTKLPGVVSWKTNSIIFQITSVLVLLGADARFGYTQSGAIPSFVDVDLEMQAYPTGLIPGLRLSLPAGKHGSLHMRGGYNVVQHRDQGVHQDERGGGFGFSLGYDRYFTKNYTGWLAGLRCDLWFNTIDWKGSIGPVAVESGTSKVTVLQPTAGMGYQWSFDHGNWLLAPGIAFGYEVNIDTRGEPTGEGAILLLGLRLGHRILVY